MEATRVEFRYVGSFASVTCKYKTRVIIAIDIYKHSDLLHYQINYGRNFFNRPFTSG